MDTCHQYKEKLGICYNDLVKIIGIDFGTKRVGTALSDETGKVAFPKEVIQNNSELLNKLEAFAKAEGVSLFVIGESRDFGGRANQLQHDINKLKADLERKGFDVRFEQEYSSSVEASRFQGVNQMIDASAAAIILQRYLDSHISK
jgi:putative Holliday junction resolvase